MTKIKKQANVLTITIASIVVLTSCVKAKNNDSMSSPLSIQQEELSDLSGSAGTADQLCDYLNAEGYFPSNSYAEGTPLAYSTSYGVDSQESSAAEAGQAHGTIMASGKFFQKNLTTRQALICPGSFSGFSSGQCLWKVGGDGGYADLAHKVVCNKAANYGSKGRLHPGYTSMKTAKVSFSASTAGQTYRHDDAVRVTLEGGNSSAHVYFAKGVGLVATEYREKALVNGTAKVYIGAKSARRGE
jgi:hypothetical protein